MKHLHSKIFWLGALFILLALLAACGKKADDNRSAPRDATSSVAEPFSRGPGTAPQVKGPSEPPPPL